LFHVDAVLNKEAIFIAAQLEIPSSVNIVICDQNVDSAGMDSTLVAEAAVGWK